jgi:hypothetical protein
MSAITSSSPRSLRETIRDTAAWAAESDPETVKIAGVPAAREAELLAACKKVSA